MLYSIIEIEDQAKKEQLAVTCDHQPFIAAAPYLLLFLADYQRWVDLFEAAGCEKRAIELGIQPRLPEEGDLMLAMMDALIAAQTAVIAAESLGIGSCYIGDILENWELHQEMFTLPRYTFPAALLCFGRSTEPAHRKLVPRFDRKFIVYKDTYRRFTAEELNEHHLPFGRQSFEANDFANGGKNVTQSIYIRKFTADFSVEMSRSVRAALRNWQEED
jgi:nitroreductase